MYSGFKKDLALLGLIVAVVLIFASLGDNKTDSNIKDTSEELDITKPIYTSSIGNDYGSMVCPSSILNDDRMGQGIDAVYDAKNSVFNHQQKVAAVGCEELRGGIPVTFTQEELNRISEINSQGKAGFVFFESIGTRVNGNAIYTGDLTNKPEGSVSENHPSQKQENKTIDWYKTATLKGVVMTDTFMNCCFNGDEKKTTFKKIVLANKLNLRANSKDELQGEINDISEIALLLNDAETGTKIPEGVQLILVCDGFDFGINGHYARPVNCIHPHISN